MDSAKRQRRIGVVGTKVALGKVMRLFPLVFLAIAACEPDAATSVRSTSATIHAAASPDLEEADYRGTFHGANVYVTIESHGALASGSCFYETDGADVPLRGAIDERGVLTLEELDDRRAISTITLSGGANGVWTGTWKSADTSRAGLVRLERITRREGAPVLVATRHLERRAGDARVPVVLGLADRVFERKLNEELAASSKRASTATFDYVVPLNEHGFVSFEITGKYLCDVGPCTEKRTGVTAAVDAHEVATDASALIDMVKARTLLVDVVKGGNDACAKMLDDDRALALVHSGILTQRGVSILYERCDEGSATRARELTFAELGPSLRSESAFAPAWRR